MSDKKKKEAELSKNEAKNLLEMLRLLMDAYGFFSENLGEIQRDHKEAYESMLSPASMMKIPEMLSELTEKAPELNKLLTGMFVKIASYLPQLTNLVHLSADEKIELGKNLKSLANDFDKLRNWLEKVEEE